MAQHLVQALSLDGVQAGDIAQACCSATIQGSDWTPLTRSKLR
jgi:hypothetical protein